MEELVRKLRTHGIAVTPQRLAILASLQDRQDHPSAEKLYREVRRQLPAISFNTVYKTLEVLYLKGLIIKVNPLHEVAHYDAETLCHAHLVCRRCRTIVNLYRQSAAPPAFASEELRGFRVEHQSICCWGVCPGCQKSEADE